MNEKDVLTFWFEDHGVEDWFMGGETFDAECRAVLGAAHAKAVRAELWHWRHTLEGRVAEIILIDQLSRQLHRGQPEAFVYDTMAVALAQEIVLRGRDAGLPELHRGFVYMPYQHAESLVLQEESVRLYTQLGNAAFLESAQGHRDTIARFGRFPKRNAALGRESTPDELAYLREREDQVF